MKKLLMILCIFLLVGCEEKKKKKEEIKEKEVNYQEEIKEPEPPKYVDTNPIKVGLYNYGKLIDNVDVSFKDSKDLCALEVVFSDIPDLGGTNLKNNWKKYYDMYEEDISGYKIGFYIEFEANGEKIENLLLDPSNAYKAGPYIYAYLYDGVHAKGRYTHLSMEDLKDDTIYSTIKIFLYQKAKEITSPISLTVFTYKDENDFIDGHYRGNSKHTVTITNKEK